MIQDKAHHFLAPNHYFDRYFDREAVKILPGEYYVTNHGLLIVTVLGSCVAACVRDPVTGIGGMNHFLLPNDHSAAEGVVTESARYGSYAMELLINHLIKMGASRQRLQAKIFGGGNVLRGLTVANVGQRNAQFVEEYLQNEGIPVVGHDLLGDYPRKVYFFTDTGKVKIKTLRSIHNTTILERESEYRLKIKSAPVSGDVDLF